MHIPDLCQHICDRLNAVLEVDRRAVTALIENRVPCSAGIVTDSPAVPHEATDGGLLLGTLGLANALVTPTHCIWARFGDDGLIIEFFWKKRT